MKYIRTKDGVYEFNENMHITNNKLINNFVNYEDIFGNKDILQEDLGKVLKEADTIEELCDEFVVVAKDMPSPLICNLKETIEVVIKNNDVLYGAIWTNKGLIYVAKMNDKGEFVLIYVLYYLLKLLKNTKKVVI